MAKSLSAWQEALLERHQLGAAYLDYAQKWFSPLADALAEHQNSAGKILLIGINGSQGSGKTTLCDYLCAVLAARHDLAAVALSLDDFYHTRARRERLARQVHPLLATRGVPGTHDSGLLQQTLDQLLDPERRDPVAIPRFDKAQDDRRPRSDWDAAGPEVAIVLLEGWCLGATAVPEQELATPVNALERDEDGDGRWRRHVNLALEREFEPLYQRIDRWVMLQAPSFDCVYHWRLQQERKLAADTPSPATNRVMDSAGIERFIQFFQRLTQQCLAQMPARVDYLYELDRDREVVSARGLREARR
jgi:D-glycerate 3-kinase